ncbi:BcsR/BcsP family cellulose biosynthesis protein [Pseudoalteromonas shioyasakiensis]|uniref:BcsR/BcsP family cellulose biosynthesis protein n=1 Tax=Pseudoalteromonas shioyasakiensis TaxID=1190813 RepID=UPI001C3C5961|nr:BcsR/BcsP family cellulose biosynthesis protein [Pseudoalteromonas shioyasakiensis]
MNNFAVKKSNTLTQYDIDELIRQFGGKETDYVEIVDVEKNRKTIKKYPLLNDIALATTQTQSTKKVNKNAIKNHK